MRRHRTAVRRLRHPINRQDLHNVNVVVIGATGAVGRVFLRIMEERNFPVDNLRKGAALNAIRIAEQELNRDLLAKRKVW